MERNEIADLYAALKTKLETIFGQTVDTAGIARVLISASGEAKQMQELRNDKTANDKKIEEYSRTYLGATYKLSPEQVEEILRECGLYLPKPSDFSE